MIPGILENVIHKGITLLVQTEDGGLAHAHIVSQVFHGGTVLAEEKTYYHDDVSRPDLGQIVKKKMAEIHSKLTARIKAGGFDVDLGLAPAAPAAPSLEEAARRKGGRPRRRTVESPADEVQAPRTIAVTEKTMPVFKPDVADALVPEPNYPHGPGVQLAPAAAPSEADRAGASVPDADRKSASLWDSVLFGKKITNRTLGEVVLDFLAERMRG